MKRLFTLLLALTMLLPVGSLAEASGELENMLAQGAQFVAQEDFDSAQICYDIASKLSPENPAVLAAMADLHLCMGDSAHALELIDAALALAPADGNLYLFRARILFGLGSLEEAGLDLRYAEICGAAPDEALNLTAAVACAQRGYYKESLDYFSRVPLQTVLAEQADLYGRALVRSGNSALAQELGLTALGAKDETLSTAIQAGSDFSLTEITQDISAWPVFCGAAYYEADKEAAEAEGLIGEPTADGLRVKLANSPAEVELPEAELLAVSPSGEIALYHMDGTPVLCRDGEITMITPDMSRGEQHAIQDTYNNQALYHLNMRIETDGIAWSPDERYIALTFPSSTLVRMQLFDLILLDTQTGEIFAAENTPHKIMQEGAQGALYACFDAAGEYVYYVVYGNITGDARCGVKRYNLATGEVELLFADKDVLFDRPGLYLDDNGSLRCVTDQFKGDSPVGVVEFSVDGGAWTHALDRFPNPYQIQYPQRYLYSANSDTELILHRYLSSQARYLTLSANPVNGRDHSRALMLPIDGNQAEFVEINEDFIKDAFALQTATINGQPTDGLQPSPWMNVCSAALSPDGYYALILTVESGQSRLWLLDTQTLRFAPIELPEEIPAHRLSISSFGAVFTWGSGDRIVLPGTTGSRLYQLNID